MAKKMWIVIGPAGRGSVPLASFIQARKPSRAQIVRGFQQRHPGKDWKAFQGFEVIGPYDWQAPIDTF